VLYVFEKLAQNAITRNCRELSTVENLLFI